MKSKGKLTWRSTLLLLLTLSVTSGCAHGLTTPPVNSYCAIAQPIRYDSRVDSAATVARIEAHNSIWVCLCENDCPASAPNTK